MEKRNYVSPVIHCNKIKITQLIAASGNVITPQEFEDKLEACLQFPDYDSDNGETSVTAFTNAYPGGTGCFRQDDKDADEDYDCLAYLQSLDKTITSSSTVQITYSNGLYTITKGSSNCSTWGGGRH